MRRIEKLEADMNQKQDCLDRLRREKIELENALEQEQEALVNRLWKKMEKLESEKRILRLLPIIPSVRIANLMFTSEHIFCRRVATGIAIDSTSPVNAT
ncbi:unnamed protein product [Trichobilharzia regenti]|nr:unnamed protein product [Trichobilharzia regenti]